MRIRPFTDEDADEASRLIETCLTDVIAHHYDERTIERIREEYTPQALVEKAKLGPMIVAEIDGRIVGTARLQGDTVFTVYVDPAMHRSRIGSKLMARIEEIARDARIAQLRIESFASSVPFYTHLGYETIRSVTVKGSQLVEMRKVL